MDSSNNNYPCMPSSPTSCVPQADPETSSEWSDQQISGEQSPVSDGIDGSTNESYQSGEDESVVMPEPDQSEIEWDRKPDLFGVGDYSDSSPEEEDASESLSDSKVRSKTGNCLPMKQKSGETSREQVKTVPGKMYVINVDGYYRKAHKGKKNSRAKGGYGVLIRRVNGEAVVAKTGCALVGVSEFFHTVEGIKKGLELVNRYPGITRIYIACNSDYVNLAVNACFQSNSRGRCLHSDNLDVICEGCLINSLDCDVPDDIYDTIVEYMKVIVILGKAYYNKNGIATYVGKGMNEPADYLAKMQLARGKEEEFEPQDFPSELKVLVENSGFLLTYPQ